MRVVNLWLAAALLGMAPDAKAAVTCDVSGAGLTFGSFAPIDGHSHDAETTIAIDCVSDAGVEQVSLAVGLDGGFSQDPATRTMRSVDGELAYNIFQDATYGVLWGDGASGATKPGVLELTTSDRPERLEFVAYARIPSGQNTAPVGTYSDLITITVTY